MWRELIFTLTFCMRKLSLAIRVISSKGRRVERTPSIVLVFSQLVLDFNFSITSKSISNPGALALRRTADDGAASISSGFFWLIKSRSRAKLRSSNWYNLDHLSTCAKMEVFSLAAKKILRILEPRVNHRPRIFADTPFSISN